VRPSNAPDWAAAVLACPRCHGRLANSASDEVRCRRCGRVGRWERGILRVTEASVHPSVRWYRSVGGARFHERTRIPFTMSSLDTPVYHHIFERLRPASTSSLIVDVGAGDGRNTHPWLAWGMTRVVATDAVFASLDRFRARLEKEHPGWLRRLLLVECDARRIPLADACVARILAIEVLCYLNEDYARGLAECRRLLAARGRLILSERAFEAGLLTALLYGGVRQMLQTAKDGYVWDGEGPRLVRNRIFTEERLVHLVEEAGLTPLVSVGLSSLPLVCGFLRQEGKLRPSDRRRFPAVVKLLRRLSGSTTARRTHVIVAARRAAPTRR
jgi:SAM-dependent methyltransferase